MISKEAKHIDTEGFSDEVLLNIIKINLELAEVGGGVNWLKEIDFQYYLAEYVARGNDITWIQDRMIKMEGE